MPTETGTAPTSGTETQLANTAAVFTNINWTAQLVANAHVDPADTPAADQARIQYDTSGRVGLYFYVAALGTWQGVAPS